MFKVITAYGKRMILHCDGKCNKAWGNNSRPKIELSEDCDDYCFLADDELGEAPEDPGTYEGGHGKPINLNDPEDMNKWCFRECERSSAFTGSERIKSKSFTTRQYNIRGRENDFPEG